MKLCRVCGRCYDDIETLCQSSDGASLVPDRPGSCIIAGKFRLLRLLGRGGVGAVYLAQHMDLEIPVALKLLPPSLTDDPTTIARFRREAQSAARLHHPGIARTHDFGILPDEGAYIVMELVEGPTLRKYIVQNAPLPLSDAVRIARQVLEAIDAAHQAGIVHRDLKPSNIIITQDHRDHQRATVVDFGLAKVTEETMNIQQGITAAGMFLGTPRYMSPEQCEGKDLDARSDIYSLGIILYEMLSGHPPFDAPSVTALALKHLQEPPPPLRPLRPDLPDDLEQAIDEALAKDPSDRPATAGELAERLRGIEERLSSSEQSSRVQPVAIPAPAATSIPPATQVPPAMPASPPAQNTDVPPEEPESAGPATIGMSGAFIASPVPNVASPAPGGRSASGTIDPVVPGARLSPPGKKFLPRDEHPTQRRSPLVPIAAIALLLLLAVTGWWLLERDNAETTTAQTEPVVPADGDRSGNGARDPVETPSQELPSQRIPTPLPPSSTPAAAKAAEPAPLAFDRVATTNDLQEGITRWIQTTNSHDLDGHLALYDARLTAFYLQRNVARQLVRAEKQQLLKGASDISISTGEINLSINRNGESATMRFPKSYTIAGPNGRRSGEVVSELIWKRTRDGWRIVSERDLRVVR